MNPKLHTSEEFQCVNDLLIFVPFIIYKDKISPKIYNAKLSRRLHIKNNI